MTEEQPRLFAESQGAYGSAVRYHGADPTETERESGEAVDAREQGRLKPNGAGHNVLSVYRLGDTMTSYEASYRAVGDYHSSRRESTRLVGRGFLKKVGTLPNPSPRGRPRVHAYRITDAGRAELRRLNGD